MPIYQLDLWKLHSHPAHSNSWNAIANHRIELIRRKRGIQIKFDFSIKDSLVQNRFSFFKTILGSLLCLFERNSSSSDLLRDARCCLGFFRRIETVDSSDAVEKGEYFFSVTVMIWIGAGADWRAGWDFYNSLIGAFFIRWESLEARDSRFHREFRDECTLAHTWQFILLLIDE